MSVLTCFSTISNVLFDVRLSVRVGVGFEVSFMSCPAHQYKAFWFCAHSEDMIGGSYMKGVSVRTRYDGVDTAALNFIIYVTKKLNHDFHQAILAVVA